MDERNDRLIDEFQQVRDAVRGGSAAVRRRAAAMMTCGRGQVWI